MPSYWVQATGRFQPRIRRVYQGCQVCSILVKQGSTIQHKQGSVILQGSMFTLHTLTLLYSRPKVDSNTDVGQVAICYLFSIILVVLRHKPFSHKGVQWDLASALVLHWVLACRLMKASTLILLCFLSTLVRGSKQFASWYWVSPGSCKWPPAMVYCKNKRLLAMATTSEDPHLCRSNNTILVIQVL